MSGFQHAIAGGAGTLVIASFQSPNYVEGVSGWQVQITGDAEFNNVKVRGQFFGSNFFLDNQGLFLYNGTPALGSLIVSAAPVGGTDPSGNTFFKGINLYGPNGSRIALTDDLTTGLPALFLIPELVSFLTVPPQVFASAFNAGSATLERMNLTMSSGKSSGQADAAVQLFGASADGTSFLPEIIFEFGGAIAATLAAGGFSSDSWHQLSLGTGWSAGNGIGGLYYQNLPILNMLLLAWDVETSTSSNANAIGTLPVGPATAVQLGSGHASGAPTSYNASFAPSIKVQPSGAVQAQGIPALSGTVELFGTAIVPLGAL